MSIKRRRKNNSLLQTINALQMSFSQHSCFFCATNQGSNWVTVFRNNFPVINVILCKIDMQLESLLKSSHRRTLWRRQRLLKQQRGGRRGEMMKTS